MLSDRDDFWPALVGAAVATASEIRATDGGITQSDDTLTVVFEGDPSFRPGVFGTTFRVPISPDDPLWNKFGPPPDYGRASLGASVGHRRSRRALLRDRGREDPWS